MEEYRVTLDKGGLNRDFVFVGGPLDAPDGLDDLFRALGFASAQWARLEQHIDAVLIHVNNREHSDTIFDAKHPISFQAKIKLLKRWFNQHPALANLTVDIRTLTTKLKELSPHRNNLIHGVLDSWDAATKTCVLRTLKFIGDDEFNLSNHEYTIEGIETVAELTAMSNRYLSTISQAIFTKDALAQLRTP
ncbi:MULTISPECIES: hypothetical protein [Chelativorans]|uniref:hypothetical protein n=1 Tax=Chelativorans TaxID=449972 RepID=UPI0013574C7E|nr:MULTISPECIES: hypothetical protein [Chelativorans]